ncbi:hypothetical protein ACEN9F_30480 [Duganella sp. CT11-25]|uniref:hypothetical protein n=1 Tax=unclassified Duganella TaxID=2636909 RepID=UPI0039B0A3C5
MTGTSSVTKLISLIAVGQLAVELHWAEHAAKMAKNHYHEKIDKFEAVHGRADSRIDPLKPEHAKLIKYTKAEYEQFLLAKRKAYNVRRRLENASRKAATNHVAKHGVPEKIS